MIKYNIRSRQLVDLIGEIRREKLIISPHFQRNLVWRTIHKIDFIKTILLGYPFPQIFLAKGELNPDELTTTSVVVDGQQRMNSIVEYISNEFKVDGKHYKDLSKEEREDFLKYEIALIELDMESDNPDIVEIFQRLNRTFYSLTKIEKLATEYAASELMLLAKLLSGIVDFDSEESKKRNPNIPPEFKTWAKEIDCDSFRELILEQPIFTNYEISRMVHLMFVLNIIATVERGIFNRNIKDNLLDEYSEEVENKDDIVDGLEEVALFYLSLRLKKTSYWYNKANFFTLVVLFYNNIDRLSLIGKEEVKRKLTAFEENIPEAYALAAKEGVNNRKERLLRNQTLNNLLFAP
ncbi:MAG: DUF262 domain-containing protein [Flavobacteriales bacterium]